MSETNETLFAAAEPPSNAADPGLRADTGGRARPRTRFNLPVRVRLFPGRHDAQEVGRSRLFVTCAIFAVAFAVVTMKLVDASLYDPARTVRLDDSRAPEALPEPEQLRADILDRNGLLIATSLPVTSVCARPPLVRNPVATAFLVAGVLPELNAAAVQAQLERKAEFVWLQRHITPKQHQALLALGEPGLCFEREQRRVYPQSGLAAHVSGFTDVDGVGIAGIELAYNDVLNERRDPLRLSLDLRVQRIVRDEVQYAMDRFQATGGVGVLMDIANSETVAMVSLPDFDPNDPGTASADARFNRATLGVYEMGSTFKLLTAAQALEAGKATLSTKFDATTPIRIGRHTISDFHALNRWLTLEEVLIHSSNVGAAKIAELSGPAAQRDFFGRLGMLKKMSIEVAELGSPLAPRRWSEVHMLTIAFGHGLAVTPMHLSNAIASLTNGGVYRQATLLKQPGGDLAGGERVVSAKVSASIRWLMRQIVINGTGRNADTALYPVGGKTGTAEKAMGRRGYDKNAKLASFISVFPINDPKYVLLVMIDEPKPRADTFGYATGGWVAAPAVKAIIERAAPIIGMPPIGPDHPARQMPILQIEKRPETRT